MRKALVLMMMIGIVLLCGVAVYAEDLATQELQLKLLETEITALRTAIQRDNAQIGLLQERIARLNGEVKTRLDQAQKLRVEIQKVKDKEKPKEAPKK